MSKEAGIQNAIEHYLALLENQGKLIYIKNNTGAFQTPRGGFYRMGKRGSSDFIIAVKDGKTLWVEVKNEKGKQNNNQLLFESDIKKLGHKYFIVRSVEDVEKLLDDLKITYN